MKTLIGAFALLSLTTAVAFADEPAEKTDDASAEQQDCSKLEGDEKTRCEEAAKAAEKPKGKAAAAKEQAEKDQKAGNMEGFDDE